jgi:hypothetical protein
MDPKILAFMMEPDDFVIGSPETVAEHLIEQWRAGGFGVVMAFTDRALFAPEFLARSHELLGTRVGPILHSADVARPVNHWRAANACFLAGTPERRPPVHDDSSSSQQGGPTHFLAHRCLRRPLVRFRHAG